MNRRSPVACEPVSLRIARCIVMREAIMLEATIA
jgi:hypothetical protein